ncbi:MULTISPECIES: amidophosphoribosyltransferase [Sorangium]|uniref:Amidophosphoribosyltransferase n=1 Tax=Sorangium cellulosum TaxID=56 RepID=A0A4P2QSY3_SORCE|nr:MULTISPECIES: amidophosphoribosyltransferase [Sorangium]AUX33457.1 amidophosphoribosyltransferase [Sorangium cellulosum]WCQ92773.1 Amidophosphoribosyltransferase [Sorangium sp. Soce836]
MCGVFGIFGHPEAANMTYLGLHALQHRGQESAGIVSSDGERLYGHRAMGRVQSGFAPSDLASLPGDRAIGHVRYSTAGGSHLKNAQPLGVDYARGSLAVAHNGNLTNHETLREQLEARGSIYQTASDTESIVHLIAMSKKDDVRQRIAEALKQVEGAYSLLFLTERELIAVRDPRAIRPLCLGEMPSGSGVAHVVASESTAFDLIGARKVRDVAPGEMVIINADGVRSEFPFAPEPRKLCIFEHVYFARPDSTIQGVSVYEVRKAFGRRLAIEQPVETGDDLVVIPVPDSGVPAAIGFADRARAPFEMGLIRSHYVGRTFIEPQQSIRHFGVRLKLNPNRAVIEGKRVVVVDDSIVRGTTSRKIVKMIRDAGAREVHVRISSPPTRWPCYYGVDTPTRSELIASSHSVDEICSYLTADSVGYLSLEGLVEGVRSIEAREGDPAAARPSADSYCHACFSGSYPIPFTPAAPSRQLRMVSG